MTAISILIPCYNAEQWIAQAIESALGQTWPEKEVIVMDDGSTDGSLDIIRTFGDRIRIETGPNHGGNPARNRLLELAQGEWLQYLDADDCLLPEHVAQQTAVAESDPRTDVVYSPVILEHWPFQADSIAVAGSARSWREVAPMDETQDPWTLLIRWRLPQTGAALWRRTAILDVGGWKENQPCCQEHELYLRMLMSGKLFVLNPHAGAVYRQWSLGTVCRLNPIETMQRRLDVVTGAEQYLTAKGELNAERRRAIALTRLEIARSLYTRDSDAALRAAAEGERLLDGQFLPPEPAFPGTYRAAYRMFGFAFTERIAGFLRPYRNRN